MVVMISLVVLAAIYAYNRFFGPKPEDRNAKPAKFGDLNFPRATEFDPLPIFWGTVRFRAPNVVWAGRYGATPIEEGENDVFSGEETVITGYQYMLGMQMVLGIPPADTVGPAKLRRMWIGDQLAWPPSGGPDAGTVGPMAESPAENWAFCVLTPSNPPEAGNAEKAYGVVDWMPGTLDQTKSATVATLINSSELPSYRGQCVVTCYTPENPNHPITRPLRGFYVGNSPSIPPFSFEVKAPGRTDVLGSFIGQIGDGDANPAVVLYDLLTSKWGKVGRSTTQINTASFLAAAQQLHLEQHGFSLILYNANEASELIKEIREQIDAILYHDPEDDQIYITLIRDDYDVGTLTELNASNVIEVASYSVTMGTELYNRVTVGYTDRDREYKESSVTVSDDAAIAAADGVVRAVTYNYPGINDPLIANQVATRQLNALSRPLTKFRLICNRTLFAHRPGAVVKFTWPELGITDMVLRILDISHGERRDNKIVVECLEDRFSVSYTVNEPDGLTILPLPLPPYPVQTMLIEEAPRWFQRRAMGDSIIADHEQQHLWYIAKREEENTSYLGRRRVNNATMSTDTQTIHFSYTSQLKQAYARTTGPVDAGDLFLEWDDRLGENIEAATLTAIRVGGKNLALLGTELIAFENIALSVDDEIVLSNVWRGLLDTVPQDHAVGTPFYLLRPPWTGVVGGTAFDLDDVVEARVLPRKGLILGLDDEATDTTITIQVRTKLPYPPSDVQMNAGYAVTALEEEDVSLTWKKREYTSVFIAQGDDASDTVADTAYDVVARRGDDAWTVIVSNLDDDEYPLVPLGAIGFGDMELGVRGRRQDPDLGWVTSWQVHALELTAQHWRNLLCNPRWAYGSGTITRWSQVAGSIVVGSTAANALGGAGYYIDGNTGADYHIRQTIDVSGYGPEGLTALLYFYARNSTSNNSDLLEASLVALDAGFISTGSDTYGPTAPSNTNYQRTELELDIPADTKYLQVNYEVAYHYTTTPECWITESCLRLGQMSDELITNGDFSGGTTPPDPVGWTVQSGTWQVLTTSPYEGGHYVRPNDGASAELRQTVAIPTGHQWSTAILEVARMNDAASDTGTVTLEELDASNNVLQSVTTGAEAITPVDTWVRRRLEMELTVGTQLRVRLIAARVSGTPLNSCFDDVRLRTFKQLEPSYEEEIRLDTPARQILPQTQRQWQINFPAVTAPDLGMWSGLSIQDVLGVAPEMETGDPSTGDAAVVSIGKMPIVTQDMVVTDALVFGGGTSEASDVHTAGNVHYANFGSDEAWTVMVVYDGLLYDTPGAPHPLYTGLIGRYDEDAGAGWGMYFDDTGGLEAYVDGTSYVACYVANALVGGPAYAAMSYDPNTNTLELTTPYGTDSQDVSAAGEFKATGLARFRIGRDAASTDSFKGNIARVYMWRSKISAADIQSLWIHGTDAGNKFATFTRAECVAAIVGEDENGYIMGTFGPNEIPNIRRVALEGGTDTGLAYLSHGPVTNLIPTDDFNNSDTWEDMGLTSFQQGFVGIDRRYGSAVACQGDNTTAFRLQGVPVSAGVVRLHFSAKGTGVYSARAVLKNDSGVVKGTFTFTVSDVWEEFKYVFTGWDATTATCTIDFFPSSTGTPRTLYLSQPVLVTQQTQDPQVYPVGQGTRAVSRPVARLNFAFDAQQLCEGEMVVETYNDNASPVSGTIVDMHASSSNNDRRVLKIDAGELPEFEHRNGSGTADTVDGDAVAWDNPVEIRCRWSRAGLFDAASAFTTITDATGSWVNVGRATTWTMGTATYDTLDIGTSGDPYTGCVRRVVLRARESRFAMEA